MSRGKGKLPETTYKVNDRAKDVVLLEKEKTKQLALAHQGKARWQWWIAAFMAIDLALIIWDRLDPGFEVASIQEIPAHWLAFIMLNLAISGISLGSIFFKKSP